MRDLSYSRVGFALTDTKALLKYNSVPIAAIVVSTADGNDEAGRYGDCMALQKGSQLKNSSDVAPTLSVQDGNGTFTAVH
jgi:hypothetical protein